MAGHPRALTRRHVYESIAQNLLGGLRAQGARVDLFALLKRGDAPGKSQRESTISIRSCVLVTIGQWPLIPTRFRSPRPAVGWNFSPVAEDETDTWRALSFLRPRSVLRLRRRAQSSVLLHRRCRGVKNPERLTSQPALWATCHRQIQLAEAEDGVGYDWVVRTRPDAWWHAPHPPLCQTALGSCTLIMHKLSCAHPGYTDQHFAIPRAAMHVMHDLADQFAACNSSFPFHSMEHWLIANLEQAAQTHDLPPPQRHSFPFVIVRNSSKEPSARLFCCGQGSEQARCLRGAYPEDAP